MAIASLLPVPSIPQVIMDLSGIAGSGMVALLNPGTVVAVAVNVKTPDEDTL